MRESIANAQDAVRQFEQGAQVTPAEVAAQIKRGIERNARRVLIGKDARLLDMLGRLRPGSYDTVMLEHVVRTYKK